MEIVNAFRCSYADIIKSKYHIIRSVAVDEVRKHHFYEFENDKMYKEEETFSEL